MTSGYLPPALPPSDINLRVLPVRVMDFANMRLMRIHKAARGPIFYNSTLVSSTVFRFDAPAGEYGVLYAAEEFETCMAETVIRERFQSRSLPLVLTETELSQRSVTALLPASTDRVHLADFTQSLFHLGLSAQVLSDPDYSASTAWSYAVFAHPQGLDGIYFRSRYANAPSIALFDRAQVMANGAPVNLLNSPLLPEFLDKYGIILAL